MKSGREPTLPSLGFPSRTIPADFPQTASLARAWFPTKRLQVIGRGFHGMESDRDLTRIKGLRFGSTGKAGCFGTELARSAVLSALWFPCSRDRTTALADD